MPTYRYTEFIGYTCRIGGNKFEAEGKSKKEAMELAKNALEENFSEYSDGKTDGKDQFEKYFKAQCQVGPHYTMARDNVKENAKVRFL